MKKIGLIVNPIAGMGGRVGLKGTDNLLEEAIRMGAIPRSPDRAVAMLQIIAEIKDRFELYCAGGNLGEDEALLAGISPALIRIPRTCTSEDTKILCRELVKRNVDLIVFAGGDGTARDVLDATQGKVPVIGIPAGVKIHSGVFAQKPEAAGMITKKFILGELRGIKQAEVMDIDEELYRREIVSSKLYGYMDVPFDNKLLQGKKSGSLPSDKANQQSMAWDVTDNMEPGTLYLIGPGSTTSCIMKTLHLKGTLIGLDCVLNRKLAGKDLGECDILRLMEGFPKEKIKLVLTPIGGQGIILGRGNQQLSSDVLRHIDRKNIIVMAGKNKLAELRGRPFIVDTGDRQTDENLKGYVNVVTGYKEYVVYKVT
ncbi:MAG: ATP-NAD kinase family protein [Proteocatella sp.]